MVVPSHRVLSLKLADELSKLTGFDERSDIRECQWHLDLSVLHSTNWIADRFRFALGTPSESEMAT